MATDEDELQAGGIRPVNEQLEYIGFVAHILNRPMGCRIVAGASESGNLSPAKPEARAGSAATNADGALRYLVARGDATTTNLSLLLLQRVGFDQRDTCRLVHTADDGRVGGWREGGDDR